MSHQHFCDYAGHYWDCVGKAVRPLTGGTEPSLCMCPIDGVPMEEGDHTECPVELLACPEHMEEQLRRMGYEPGTSNMPHRSEATPEEIPFKDENGNRTVGFCLWCNKDFYSMEEVEAHNANDMAACPVFQQLKDEHCMPPVLQMMFEDAGLLDEDEPGEDRKK